MIIVPELKTVVILVPRACSTSIKRAVLAKYPMAFCPYRHMEADGAPYGYDRWDKIGVVRPPLARLWSVYRYCKTLGPDMPTWSPGRSVSMHASTDIPFVDWLRKNTDVFATAAGPLGTWEARYTTLHPKPENRKSQWIYLRPDLGTCVYRFDRLALLEDRLDVKLERTNAAPTFEHPAVEERDLSRWMRQRFAWDAEMAGGWW